MYKQISITNTEELMSLRCVTFINNVESKLYIFQSMILTKTVYVKGYLKEQIV